MRHRPMYPQGWFSEIERQEYLRLIRLLPIRGSMVEVGVWLGRSLCGASQAILERQIRVTAVDHFQKIQAANYRPPLGGQLRSFLINVKRFGLEPSVKAMPSLEAAASGRGRYDLVFLDADHSYEAIAADIDAWLPRTKRILAGHDYGHRAFPGVKRAVDERFSNVTVKGQVWSVELAHA